MKFQAGDRVRLSAKIRRSGLQWAKEIGERLGTVVEIGGGRPRWETFIRVYWDAPIGVSTSHFLDELEHIDAPVMFTAVCVDTINLELAERIA